MRLLVEAGLAVEHKFGENQTRYEPKLDDEHHDHLICVRCGRIVEFEDEAIEAFQTELASRHGLRILRHKHEIYGECVPSCALLDKQA
jgi:Fur family ferric uptake transcriptional regulator